MKNTPKTSGNGGNNSAFTLVEVLVVIAVVALLAMLQFAAMAGAKDQTKTGICANNIRQLLMVTQIYASENKENLPLPGTAVWAWDISAQGADALLNSGIEKRDFYCPGTSPRFTDKENWAAPGIGINSSLWNFGVVSTPPGPTSFRIVGYALAFSNSQLVLSNRNTTMLPEPLSNNTLPPPPAAERVLIADATISLSSTMPGYLNPANNYTSIQGGFSQNGLTYPHTSPHLKGMIPAGGNLGFKDGHVTWKNFDTMIPRTSSGTFFWW